MGEADSSSTSSSGEGGSTGEGTNGPGTSSGSSKPGGHAPLGASGEPTYDSALDDGPSPPDGTKRPTEPGGKPGASDPTGNGPAGTDDADDADDADPESLQAGGASALCAAGGGREDPSALATLVGVFALLGARQRRS